ncbi:hypothetical protein C8R47DRAFT_1094953 [Mycena vitilis]|nr:hypothetical protein C8R47DRAFT_1094953 [Mycena vitilis]
MTLILRIEVYLRSDVSAAVFHCPQDGVYFDTAGSRSSGNKSNLCPCVSPLRLPPRPLSMAVNSKANIFRVISFSLAGGDVLQTIPGTVQLYRKQWRLRTLSPVCFFYAVARYMTIISLITNGIGFYGTTFTAASCKPFYMVPNVTAMLAGMAVQILIFIRTYAISGRSALVYWGLGVILLMGFPVQIFGIVYHRLPETKGGECKGKVFAAGEPDWNIVYYSAHMAYDVIACATGAFYLVYSARMQGTFTMSRFIRRVLRNGLLYTLVVFLANLWVVLEFEEVFKTGVGATLPLAIVLIAVQHLILSTQRLNSDSPSSTDNYYRSRSGPLSINGTHARKSQPPPSPRRPFPGPRHSSQDLELQSGVYVVRETYTQREEDIKEALPCDEESDIGFRPQNAK